ncbi:hypothetical protein HHE92_12045 [Pseudoalteromonas arctica]|nr:hypothetical protein [Pseudoalteromonas arctica]NMP80530.1 hypothetical protein [Pseudoalteromonas arctica]
MTRSNKALQAILQTRPLFAVRAKAQKIGQASKTPELGVKFTRDKESVT